MQKIGFEPRIFSLADWHPKRLGHGESTGINAIFNEIIQHLLHSKVAKAESYLIGGYHNEWLELTYYIETLDWALIIPGPDVPILDSQNLESETLECQAHKMRGQ